MERHQRRRLLGCEPILLGDFISKACADWSGVVVALRSLALCAGVGGLDIGVRLARPDHRLVGVVERQAYCAAVLVARMEDSSVDSVAERSVW